MIRGAGHFLQDDRGDELARVVVEWMGGLGAIPAAAAAKTACVRCGAEGEPRIATPEGTMCARCCDAAK